MVRRQNRPNLASRRTDMLNAIRTASSKWLGRLVLTVIMGVLIVSFAIWGIGDIFRGGVNRTVASVGSTKISADEFRASFNTELRRLQQRVRRVVTTEEARAFGLDRSILNRSLDEAALNQKAQALGMAADQAAILRSITENPDFRTGGLFDRNRMMDALSQSGLSEQAFVQKQGEFLLRLQMYNGLVAAMPASESLGRAVHQYREEQRNLDVISVPVDKVPAAAEPDDAALKAFYDERKAEFRTVETRKLTVLRVSPADFAAGLQLTEADLRAYYDSQLASGRFGSPEKRQIQRLLFDTEAEAKAAAEKIAAGGTFEALLAEKKLTEKDVDFGLKAAGEIADPGVRAAVFATPEGKITAPLADPFGFVILRVTKVEPARVTPFEAVKGQIEADARADKLQRDPTIRGKLEDAHKKIEDQRIAGKSLGEAAAAAGLAPVVINAVDRQGNDGAGGRVNVPGGSDVLNAAFASDIGLDNEPVQQRDGGYVWFEINGIEPARDKSLDEVKADVRTRLMADRRDRALAEFVSTLLKKMEGGATLATIAQETGLPVQRVAGLKRSARDPLLGQTGVERAFAGPVGRPQAAPAGDGASRLIIVPVESSLLPYDPAQDDRSGIAQQISQGMSEDMIAQYIAAIRKELGVSINEALLVQALGQTTN